MSRHASPRVGGRAETKHHRKAQCPPSWIRGYVDWIPSAVSIMYFLKAFMYEVEDLGGAYDALTKIGLAQSVVCILIHIDSVSEQVLCSSPCIDERW